MPVLGAVVTLAPTLADPCAAVAAVPGVSLLGELTKGRLPIVVETERRGEEEDVFDALRALPFVLCVDLAYADFSDLTGTPPQEHQP